MTSLTVSLPDQMRLWIDSRVGIGAYADAGEYLRDLIRRDQAETAENEALAAALVEGEASGISDRRIPDIVAAHRAWVDYEKGGLHATGEEVDAWLRQLEAGVVTAPPECHR